MTVVAVAIVVTIAVMILRLFNRSSDVESDQQYRLFNSFDARIYTRLWTLLYYSNSVDPMIGCWIHEIIVDAVRGHKHTQKE